MSSIPVHTSLCQVFPDPLPSQTEAPAPELIEQFYAQAKREIVKGDYLQRKWLPRNGPRFYALIKALRAHCSYAIKEGEAHCWPSEETLARECGVSRRTLLYWLKRDEQGHFCHQRHGEALQEFLRIKGEKRYDPVGKRGVKTANSYFICMDDPAVPEDEPLIWEEFGDTTASSGTRKVLSSLVAADAPADRMTDLAYLARDRVRAFVSRGGRILDSQVGFYITTLCNLAKEARRKGWNLERIAAADRRRHERIIGQGQQRTPTYTTSQALPRPARPAQRRPTPQEAEALVLEWGQQEETSAQAQAQVRRIQEQRQAREGIHQAVQQQVHLFNRLAQAEQALTMHPEGGLAWERAEREKQELERQLAALRQSGESASAAPPTPGKGNPHPLMQEHSEQAYREAIHAWARARRWTVKHGTYGGSQRDWQSGLMAAGRAELRTLAAEPGV